MFLRFDSPRVLAYYAVLLLVIQSAVLRAQTPEPYTDIDLAKFAHVETVSSEDGAEILKVKLEGFDPARLAARSSYTFWVVGSPDGDSTVSTESVEWVAYDAAGKLHGPYTDAPNDELPDLNAKQFQEPRVRMVDVFRFVGMYRVELTIGASQSQATADSRESYNTIVQSMELRIKTPPAGEGEKLSAPVDQFDPYMLSVLRIAASNPDGAAFAARLPRGHRTFQDVKAWSEMMTEAAKRGPILEAKVKRGGIYSLAPADLEALGIQTDDLSPDRLRIFAGQHELAATSFKKDERFRGTARLFFFVPFDDKDLEPYTPLWVFLAGEGESGRRAELMNQSGASPPWSNPVTAGARIFEPNEFEHSQAKTSPELSWLTARIGAGSFSSFEFESPKPFADRDVKLSVWAENLRRPGEPVFQVSVNGLDLEEKSLTSTRTEQMDYTLPASVLKEGVNSFSLTCLEKSTGYQPTVNFIQATMEIPSESSTVPMNQPMILNSAEPTSATVTLKGAPGLDREGIAADISKPYDPIFYRTAMRGGQGPAYAGIIDIHANTRLVHAATDGALRPALQRVTFPDLAERTAAIDQFMVYHPDLRAPLARLIDHNSKSRTVEAVSVEDIYNVYSYGAIDYLAIEEFIDHCFFEREGARLSQVLLVGEASEWWWDPKPGVQENMLPIYGWRNPSYEIRGDEGYALISGAGPIPDIEIGRMSANDAEELSVIIDKTIDYSSNPPTGEWRNEHVFVLDDEPEFLRVAKDIIGKTFNGINIPRVYALEDYPYEDYFRGIWRKRSVAMTDAIVEAINNGARTITYLGHGGPNLWSSERIFHIRDIDLTRNDGRQPVLLAGSCDTGWVDYPVEPVKTSLSEHFLRRENGGTVAAYIPVGATSSFEHNYLLSAFYDPLINKGVTELGQLVLLSKLNYFLPRNNESVTEQFLLMGDPSLQMISPSTYDTVVLYPEKMPSSTGGKLQVLSRIPGVSWGMAQVTVLGPDGMPIADRRYRVRNGELNQVVELPAYLTPGDYSVVVSAFNNEQRVQHSAVKKLTVVPNDLRIEWQDRPFDKQLAELGQPWPVVFRIYNDSSADLIGGQFEISEGTTGQAIVRVPISIPAGKMVEPAFTKPLPPQIGSIVGRIVSPGENGAPPRVISETTVIVPPPSDYTRFISVPAGSIEVHRDAENAGLLFNIPVHNLSTTAFENLTGVLKWRPSGEDAVAVGEPVSIGTLAPGEATKVEIRSEETFPQGREGFSFEIYRGPADSGLPLQVEVFSLPLRLGPDLAIVPGSLILEDEHAYAGNTSFFRFRVRNDGDAPMTNIEAKLYLREPWIEGNIAPDVVPWATDPHIDRLDPGEEKQMRLRWDAGGSAASSTEVFATVTSSVHEATMKNNAASLRVKLLAPPNLRLIKDQIIKSRSFALPYETIHFTIPFENNSASDFAREFRLTAYALSVTGDRNRVFMRRFDGLASGEKATMELDWVVQPGENALSIELNEDREYLEETHDDNVVRYDFPYVMRDAFFPKPEIAWDYTSLFQYGSMKGLLLHPGPSVKLADHPMAQPYYFGFSRETLVSGVLGNDTEVDDRWGLRESQMIFVAQEKASAVGFRIPLPTDDDTTLYDLYINHGGGDGAALGDFEYRLEGEENWTLMNDPTRGRTLLRRVETRDDFLDIELRSPEYTSVEHIFNLEVSPIMGEVESPVVAFAQPAGGRFLADSIESGRTHIDYAVRWGSGDPGDVKWQSWKPIAIGDMMPQQPPGTGFFQWRARLFGSQTDTPSLARVRIETTRDSLKGTEMAAVTASP